MRNLLSWVNVCSCCSISSIMEEKKAIRHVSFEISCLPLSLLQPVLIYLAISLSNQDTLLIFPFCCHESWNIIDPMTKKMKVRLIALLFLSWKLLIATTHAKPITLVIVDSFPDKAIFSAEQPDFMGAAKCTESIYHEHMAVIIAKTLPLSLGLLLLIVFSMIVICVCRKSLMVTFAVFDKLLKSHTQTLV